MKAILLLLAALLSGCSSNLRNPSAIAVYDFGPIAVNAAPDRFGGRVALDVDAVPWLDTPIDYRLAYDDKFRRHQYANSRWASAPAVLMEQRLRRLFGLAGSSSGTAAGCLLQVDIQEFAQVFDSPSSSYGLLQGRVLLIDGRRRAIADRPFFTKEPAETPDAQGGARALIRAAQELGADLTVWLDQLDRKNGLVACGVNRRE